MYEDHNTFSPFSTARGTLYLVAKAIVAAASAGIFFIAIARSLPTASELGLYQGLQYLITISVTLAGSGLSRASVRYISVYIGAGKEDLAKKIYLLVFIIGLGLSALFSIIIYASADYLSLLLFHDIAYAYLVQLVSVDIFLFTMVIYSTSLLYALQAFSKAVIISIVNSLVKFSVAFSLVVLGMGIGGIIIGFIAGDALGLTLFLYVLMPKFFKTCLTSLVEIKALFCYSLPLYGYSVLLYISTEMDVYLLLILSSLSTVGTYSPAVLIGTALFLFLTALDQSIAPLFSRIYGRSGLKSLSELSRFASRYIFLIYMPIGFVTLASIPVILGGFLGERYIESSFPAAIMVVTMISISLAPIFNNILLSAGHTRIFVKSAIVALSSQFLLSIFMIPYFGGLGAAIAKASAYAILFFLPALELQKISGSLNYDQSAFRSGLVGSVIMALVLFSLNFYWSSPYFLPLNIGIGLLIYLIFIRFTAILDVKDIDIINRVLPPQLRWITKMVSKLCIRQSV